MPTPDLPSPGKAPCGTCPYRKDVPAGVWAAEEYFKLPEYDGETFEQINALGLFYCHQQPGKLCAGWVGCHDMTQLLAVRLHPIAPEAYDYVSPVPLFASGMEAAVHGLSAINKPGKRAQAAIRKLLAKVGRLRDANA